MRRATRPVTTVRPAAQSAEEAVLRDFDLIAEDFERTAFDIHLIYLRSDTGEHEVDWKLQPGEWEQISLFIDDPIELSVSRAARNLDIHDRSPES